MLVTLLDGISTPYLFDTGPLKKTLERYLGAKRIPPTHVRLAINAVNARTGGVVRIVNHRPTKSPRSSSKHYRYEPEITLDMLLASASIPLLFNPVPVGDHLLWDGGLLVNSPMAPAVALGARRIVPVLVTTAAKRSSAEQLASFGSAVERLADTFLENAYNIDRKLLLDRNELAAHRGDPNLRVVELFRAIRRRRVRCSTPARTSTSRRRRSWRCTTRGCARRESGSRVVRASMGAAWRTRKHPAPVWGPGSPHQRSLRSGCAPPPLLDSMEPRFVGDSRNNRDSRIEGTCATRDHSLLRSSHPMRDSSAASLLPPRQDTPSGFVVQPRRDSFLPFSAPPSALGLVTQVRSTLIATSIQSLRTRGLLGRYTKLLQGPHKETVLTAVAGSWLPVEVAHAHYAACEALHLDSAQSSSRLAWTSATG